MGEHFPNNSVKVLFQMTFIFLVNLSSGHEKNWAFQIKT